MHAAYDEVRSQQQRATHRQKRNYDSKAVARTFPIGCWVLRYYPPARKDKLCSPWIGPYKILRATMEWVVGIQVDANVHIFYVHMEDLKRCAPPDPTPSWPEVARGSSIVLSTRTPCVALPSYSARAHHPQPRRHSQKYLLQDQTDPQCQYRIKARKMTIRMRARCAHPL